MEKVTGIGGFFFAAQDPAALGRWYAEHLGVDEPPLEYGASSWRQQAGTTVLAPMEAGSPHLGPTGWAVNFRVRSLDAMVAQLRAAGVAVEVDEEEYPNGRFADLLDPEGNRVQLWEPTGADA
ncbi:Glyoxalase/Bleomycin resistance protein/Dioxygenase superfamily protein [Rathayibacter oskolensis]|uniref:Glyoxalase/Bleomycin resistance protein/Dioxygenase superfamily protein n=1 Tax=Rathayibacter oskolensis TaxID=1891671 RepID=A0A1X7PBV8_9MICO|nr:VOC family protein [Rathayibacter oskolensis]SMH48523.1 Glyoxalase/Bleomycin resistance protein/Dioxygenase superfamily protein [Rathayibacter oskolensis]